MSSFMQLTPPDSQAHFSSGLFYLPFLPGLCAGLCAAVSHGAAQDEIHPAAASAAGSGPVAAILVGCDVRHLCLLSGTLPEGRATPEG